MSDRRDRELQDYVQRIGGDFEPRISRSDEQRITDGIRRDESDERRRALVEAFAVIDAKLDFIAGNLAVAVPGDHRNRIKAMRRVMRAARLLL
jgi:hypothetical protein